MKSFDMSSWRERNRSEVRVSHGAGKRSESHAQRIMALSEQERTPLQIHMMQQHARGECIGCTKQGIPLDWQGQDLPQRLEPNGFASPSEFCDCPKGQLYLREQTSRRTTYRDQRIQEHLRMTRQLFGASCVLPPVMAGWRLETWPIEVPRPNYWTQEECDEITLARRDIKSGISRYAESLALWDEGSWKQGIALFGTPGVGKSGLLRCLEPILLARGLSMISLYVPDLVVALESEQVEQMLAVIRATDVVLLDNLGFLVGLGYKETQGRLALIRLINACWERQQKTLVTSNATEEQLIEQLGEDSVSRLHALCRFIEVPGVDLRRRRGE